MAVVNSLYSCHILYNSLYTNSYILYDFQDLSEVRLEVEGEEVGGQILPHFYCEDMMNVMNKVIVLLMLLVMSMVVVTVL